MEDFGMLVSGIAYSESFFKVAIGLTNSRCDAKDLIQDTVLKALRFQYQFSSGNLFGWLVTIMRNAFINKQRSHYHLKTIMHHSPELISDEWIEPEVFRDEGIISESDKVEVLFNSINKLHKTNKEPITMALSGYKMSEIAGIIGVPEGTVKSRIFKGKKQLREIISFNYKKAI